MSRRVSAGRERPAFLERAWLATYRVLLLLLPREFRREHGEECVALFRRTLRDAERSRGRTGALPAAVRGCLGALRGAVEETRDAWRRRRVRSRASIAGFLRSPSENRSMLLDALLREGPRAMRRLLRAPAFSTTVVLTLAIAIGANSAVFTVANGVVLSPLPYPESDRLVSLEHGSRTLGIEGMAMTSGVYLHYRDASSLLESIAIHQGATWSLRMDGADPIRAYVLRTTPSLGRVLRATPGLGRWFTDTEGTPGAPPVAVLSHAFWQQRFGGDPSAIGRTLTHNDTSYEIIGVMPPGFAYPQRRRPDVWVPLQLDETTVQIGGFNYTSVARLTDGASMEDLTAELDRLISRLTERYPPDAFGMEFIADADIFAQPRFLKDALVGSIATTLWVLLGSAAVVLLIACGNVANLFLVRAEARQREMAVRRALGAGKAEVPALLVTESLLLGLLGGAAGLALALAGSRLLVAFGPQDLPRLDEVRIDATVTAFTAALSLLAGLACGAVPFLRRGWMSQGLQEVGATRTATKATMRVRHLLMGGQVALSLVLLVAAGLMARSFQRLLEADPGFSAEGVLVADVGLPFARYSSEAAANFHERLLERIRVLPGVTGASATTCAPLARGCWSDPVLVQGRAAVDGEIPPLVSRRRIASGYFGAMDIPLVAGRLFEPTDHRSPTRAVIVNERFADLYFPGQNPIGQRIWFDVADTTAIEWYEVVGVVPHVVETSLASLERRAQLYVPLLSHGMGGVDQPHAVDLVVRTSTSAPDLAPAVRAAVAELDPTLLLGRITTFDDLLARDRAPMAFAMVLILIAGSAALALGLVGVYGVIAFGVSRRTGEIGIRIAMGARPADVARMVLRQGLVVATIGVAVGLGVALAASRLLESLLFGVSPTDPATYAAVAAGLFAVSLAACWLPARRAARLDPVSALRTE